MSASEDKASPRSRDVIGEQTGAGGENGTPREVRFEGDHTPQRNCHATTTIRYNKNLLRKRLDVEEWMDSQIRLLYGLKADEDCDLFVDLDDVSQFHSDEQKRSFIKEVLKGCQHSTDNFIRELLDKMRNLESTDEKHSRTF
ncbi:protein phosphatase 1 regulatory subunit 14C-like [Convolutriloba macropyga]|uniref:protein phosphatase 1 regulatory subunit 14C-like n=1 Tax=Convolutriloba macropyga TaxID=536237 RepID=UPI003F523A9C